MPQTAPGWVGDAGEIVIGLRGVDVARPGRAPTSHVKDVHHHRQRVGLGKRPRPAPADSLYLRALVAPGPVLHPETRHVAVLGVRLWDVHSSSLSIISLIAWPPGSAPAANACRGREGHVRRHRFS